MPMYDLDGTAAFLIQAVYDCDGTTCRPVKTIYDLDGTAAHVVYDETQTA